MGRIFFVTVAKNNNLIVQNNNTVNATDIGMDCCLVWSLHQLPLMVDVQVNEHSLWKFVCLFDELLCLEEAPEVQHLPGGQAQETAHREDTEE